MRRSSRTPRRSARPHRWRACPSSPPTCRWPWAVLHRDSTSGHFRAQASWFRQGSGRHGPWRGRWRRRAGTGDAQMSGDDDDSSNPMSNEAARGALDEASADEGADVVRRLCAGRHSGADLHPEERPLRLQAPLPPRLLWLRPRHDLALVLRYARRQDPGTSAKVVFTKVFIDQVLWNPCFGVMLFSYAALLEARASSTSSTSPERTPHLGDRQLEGLASGAHD